jgi:hypothetical protein
MRLAGFGLAMREYSATMKVVLMLVEGSQTYTLALAGRVRKKQALRDSFLGYETALFSLSEEPITTTSYIA